MELEEVSSKLHRNTTIFNWLRFKYSVRYGSHYILIFWQMKEETVYNFKMLPIAYDKDTVEKESCFESHQDMLKVY